MSLEKSIVMTMVDSLVAPDYEFHPPDPLAGEVKIWNLAEGYKAVFIKRPRRIWLDTRYVNFTYEYSVISAGKEGEGWYRAISRHCLTQDYSWRTKWEYILQYVRVFGHDCLRKATYLRREENMGAVRILSSCPGLECHYNIIGRSVSTMKEAVDRAEEAAKGVLTRLPPGPDYYPISENLELGERFHIDLDPTLFEESDE